MDKKNTMLLTVIAVATLLVAVVGATFAYFSVTSGTDTSTTNLTTTTRKVGTVTLTDSGNDLYLPVTAQQMSYAERGHSFYSTTDSTATAALTEGNQVTDTVLATFTLSNASAGDLYECNFNWTLRTTSDSANFANLDDEDGVVYLSLGSGLSGIASSYTLADTRYSAADSTTYSGVSGTGKVRFTGATQTATVTGYAKWTNTTTLIQNGTTPRQNQVADLNLSTALTINLTDCDTVSAFSS